ncbi:hypothetical protein [Natrinema sp. H-ect4]|uniref:hypothetical protein n=1 Tax=Natrinema sp. H-ect4 TaxID=3242699 RepID=UPI0035A96AC3
MSDGKREVPSQGQSHCDGCGQTLGHGDDIVKEYDEITPEGTHKDSFVFGQRECREIFEEHHGVNQE